MTTVAAVDVGTNSVRLLVAERGDGMAGLRDLDRRTTITRLGLGVDATGHLDDGALARTLECIAGYAQAWTAAGAQRVAISATSAVRDAADRQRFFDGVHRATGVHAHVLTGAQEAAAAFRGAVASVSGTPPWLVCDIGGGSTEFILGTGTPQASVSRQLGCVRLTERFLTTDPPTAGQLGDASAAVDAHLEAVRAGVDVTAAATLVGVAGTVTTLAALHLGLDVYQPEVIHGSRVPAPAVRGLVRQLAGMTVAQRAALGPMAPGREDVIVAGAVILARILEVLAFDEVLASEADILDGLALGLLDPAATEPQPRPSPSP